MNKIFTWITWAGGNEETGSRILDIFLIMVVEYIRYKIQPDKREAFIEAYSKASKQLDASEDCLAYELSECEEEQSSFILRIEWISTERHLNGFRKSSVFPEFFANIKAFFDEIQEMRHYNLTSIAKRK